MLYSQKCRSCSPPRSRSGTAHPSSSWCREVQVAGASHAWRGHPTDSHMCCQDEIMMSEVLNLLLLFSRKGYFFAGRNVDVSTPTRGSDSLWLDQISFRHLWDVIATTASPQLSFKTFCNLPQCTPLTSPWTFWHVFQHGKNNQSQKSTLWVLIAWSHCRLLLCHSVVSRSTDISLSEMDSFTAEGKSQCLRAEHRSVVNRRLGDHMRY